MALSREMKCFPYSWWACRSWIQRRGRKEGGSPEGGDDRQHLINQRRGNGNGGELMHLENREKKELTGLESC